MDQGVGLVLSLRLFPTFLVFLGMSLGVLHHGFNIVIGQTTTGLDTDLLFLACSLVLCGDVDNAVSVNVEGNLDLRHAARCSRKSHKIKLPQQLIIGSHFALALGNSDCDC